MTVGVLTTCHTSRSPNATPCDFFLWGYVKGQVYVPPLPASIPELKVRIRTAIETITGDVLQTVWNELGCRADVCRITKGAHIRYVTKTWSVVLLNKKYIYSYLKCIVYDKLLKPQQSFRITLYVMYVAILDSTVGVLLLLLLLLSSSSSSPLCRVFILIFLRQSMSLGNTVLQLFCCFYS